MKLLTAAADNDADLQAAILSTLKELTPKVKEIATNYKKPVAAEKQTE